MAAAARSYGRSAAQMRPVTIEPGFVRTADGSALISVGETRVICTASIEDEVPRWLRGSGRGWVTGEYAMLPASTGERKQRDSRRGRPDGRSVEIQRLIGRALRVVVEGTKDGRTVSRGWELVDRYDAERGISAMMRTTGYSLSITGQLQAQRVVAPGVCTPDECVPAERYIAELGKRGIDIKQIA